MRQVPHYIIIGNGRTARHFQHYFSLLSLSFSQWDRQQSLSLLRHKLSQATHILLLISDDAIELFIQAYLDSTNVLIIHFSGSLVTTLAYGLHPLMTFGQALYDLTIYRTIPFLIDHHTPDFSVLLPGLENPHYKLHTSLKPKYHALCVLSGNFSCLLWQKFFHSLEKEFHLPHEIAYPFLKQHTNNLLHQYKSALTGPLVRKDRHTLQANLAALKEDEFQEIYQNFVEMYFR